MSQALPLLRPILFGRLTAGVFFILWPIAIGGFAWLASGLWIPHELAAVFDLVFIKLLTLPGIILFSAVLPEALFNSVIGLVLAISLGYFLVAITVSASYQAIRRQNARRRSA
ncbi:hypothetical protein [Natranaeroarchaeum sulfidigenes]|uniref:Uncharacterized protein n=1 Tax=Natranaeroarchaeum sulfidigenes TaxID=2784880 RepID=A0A897MPQ3_9EURY|nr:hypothetical protein [Natranaeroarchaeum sulfidigenes]QSG02402.1 hypothetical protein AArcS_1184 [Natranaeroarchaeum sulfidigenes]